MSVGSVAPGLAVVLDGIVLGPLKAGIPFGLVVEQFVGVLVGVKDGDEAVAGVLALGELKLGPVGGIAGDVGDLDALGDLDLKPDEVGLLGDGGLFLALALGSAAAARCAPAAADKGKRGKEGDAKGQD